LIPDFFGMACRNNDAIAKNGVLHYANVVAWR
jgi:hypothetical protein